MLSLDRIFEELNNLGVCLPKILFYEETDSTNTRAREYAKENPGESAIFIADCQSAGRGRRGRSFVSNRGAGIYISFLIYPEEKVNDATQMTAKAAVALARAVESMCGCKIDIKWVNDLYLGGKKLAGILTEGEVDNEGKIAYQVVGMGINVYKNAISEEISGIATSLENEVINTPDRSRLTAKIILEFLSPKGDYYSEYRSRSFVIGREITVIKLTESYKARVVDLNPDYSLQIERDGRQEKLFTGEISIKTDSD